MPLAPALRLRPLWLVLLGSLLFGCASQPGIGQSGPEVISAARTADEFVTPVGNSVLRVYDPWEPFNRRMYAFNARFDQYLFLPTVDAYQRLPVFAQDRFHNFFRNIDDIRNLVNSLLQFKAKVALNTSARLVWNSTLGILGLWDPATAMGIPKQKEDFGQTLGHWGIAPGPYLVLPILGPSSLRDGVGSLADFGLYFYTHPVNFIDDFYASTAYTGIYAVDLRSSLNFRYYQTGSPFEYQLVRLLHTKVRQTEVDK